jgi:hypothetical protein
MRPGRLLADVDALLLDILIPAVALGEGHVAELLPANYMRNLPFVHAYRWGGSFVHPQFLDQAVVDVHVYADDKTQALDLAETCRTAFFYAVEQQTVYPHGSLTQFGEQSAPVALRLPNQPDGLTRVPATYRLWVCPPVSNT